jgi:hypothetical protein
MKNAAVRALSLGKVIYLATDRLMHHMEPATHDSTSCADSQAGNGSPAAAKTGARNRLPSR